MEWLATPYHLFCFVYIGFAHLSNKNIGEKEMNEIQRKVAIWMNVNPNNIVEFNLILHQSSKWYNDLKPEEKLTATIEVSRNFDCCS